MKKYLSLLCMLSAFYLQSQYNFTPIVEVPCTDVKSQGRTGTCWSFATTSFLESELIRQGKPAMDLSEMFIVRNIYKQKAINYILRQGKANFSQGSLAHDQLNAAATYGIVPEYVYPGNIIDDRHDHGELEKALKGFLDGVIANKNPSEKWMSAFDAILDVYLGAYPTEFIHNGSKTTPLQFANAMGFAREEYIGITSFSHHPYGISFILEIPDNFSNGSYHNVTLDNLLNITKDALEKGYTISWDGDVSEKSFSAQKGLAILPNEKFDNSMFNAPVTEKKVTPALRQKEFYNWNTTDDHLMHIVGMVEDQQGHVYFKVKNSWGEISDYKGFLYMSEAYFLQKTVSIFLHKKAIEKGMVEGI